MAYWLLQIPFLLLLGIQISVGMTERLPRHDRPMIYWDETFSGLMKLTILPWLILFVVLLIMDWKTTLLFTLGGAILGGLLRRISERIIIAPLWRLLVKK